MFIHNFKYSLKVLFRSKSLLFWTFIFPIVLGTLFNLAFSNIESNEKLSIINIAIVNDDNFNKNEIYKEMFTKLSDINNKDRIFNTVYTNVDEAKTLLEKKEITGYLIFDSEISIVVNSSGFNETILRFVVDEISSEKQIYESLIKNTKDDNIDYSKMYNETIDKINSNVKISNITRTNLSYTMIEYYTLIAMAILYGSMISMFITNKKLANMNSVGKRTSISPVHKGSILISSLLASYLVQLLGLIILIAYTILVIHVDYGSHLWLVILLILIGTIASLSLGMMISVIFKTHEEAKIGILIAITMIGCFLSGMMGITMKYVIDKNVPILNIINPANMITDGFYSLYYYNTLSRFYFNIVSLVIFSAIMIIVSFWGLRRKKYDSI